MSKFKLVITIFLHLLFWVLNYKYITTGNLGWNGFDNVTGTLATSYKYGLLFNMFLFYVQVFLWVPKFYIHQKRVVFWLGSIVLFLVSTTIESYLDMELALKEKATFDSNFPPVAIFVMWFFQNSIFHFIYSLFGFFYRFQFEFFKSEKAKRELLKENYTSELKYLRAQLNPHFLFNGINSVYHLMDSNISLAKKILLDFSGLLRYQLYESETPLIDLDKELEYIAQYIKIEEIRKGEDILLESSIESESINLKIAPLLLTPFVENAFKHCSNHNENSRNRVSIVIEEKDAILNLEIKNTFQKSTTKVVGGLGLKNTKRRLELLYPEKHALHIEEKEEWFSVKLKLDL